MSWFFNIFLLLALLVFMIDSLTFLWVRRIYELFYRLTIKRKGYLVFIDLDNFKKINTLYGHQTGDRVLREVGKKVQRISWGKGFRYGGDEIVVLLPFSTREEAAFLAGRIRRAIERLEIDGVKFNATCVVAKNEELASELLLKAKGGRRIIA